MTNVVKIKSKKLKYVLFTPYFNLKTLFICSSNASGVDPDSALREKSGKIEIVEVDVPGTGRP